MKYYETISKNIRTYHSIMLYLSCRINLIVVKSGALQDIAGYCRSFWTVLRSIHPNGSAHGIRGIQSFVLQHFFDQLGKKTKFHCNSLKITHWVFQKQWWRQVSDVNLFCFATFVQKEHVEKMSKYHCNSFEMTHWMCLKAIVERICILK